MERFMKDFEQMSQAKKAKAAETKEAKLSGTTADVVIVDDIEK
jgi:hypothetical protein